MHVVGLFWHLKWRLIDWLVENQNLVDIVVVFWSWVSILLNCNSCTYTLLALVSMMMSYYIHQWPSDFMSRGLFLVLVSEYCSAHLVVLVFFVSSQKVNHCFIPTKNQAVCFKQALEDCCWQRICNFEELHSIHTNHPWNNCLYPMRFVLVLLKSW